MSDKVEVGGAKGAGLDPLVSFLEPATVQNPTAVHSARDDFLKVAGVARSPVPQR